MLSQAGPYKCSQLCMYIIDLWFKVVLVGQIEGELVCGKTDELQAWSRIESCCFVEFINW